MSATAPEHTLRHDADEVLLGFARALRHAGVAVTQDRASAWLAAAAAVGVDDRAAVRAAGRATLCSCPEDLARFDQVFAAWFDADVALPGRGATSQPVAPVATTLPLQDLPPGEGEEGDDEVVRAVASEAEVLRHRDVADLSPGERQRLGVLFQRLRPRAPVRPTPRHQAWHSGEVDARRTLRATLHRMGEPAEIAWRRRATRCRRVVLLVDVSGSMSAYADALLRLSHRITQGCAGAETFTLGTRITHLTRAMRVRDPERALVAAGEVVPDWSGGTRLGETLRAFTDRWGRRGLARGAVVVVFSDGWERGDPTELAEQVRRVHRLAHRLVWVNPHRGKEGYEPVQQGVRAVLPHVDDFLAGHSLATFEDLLEVVAGA